ncbi:unnamed protein product [Orchesella dallaii]|uniref:Tight junction protein ZO-1 n=1 Tax=Orchesella dallaii TaxID=48710 RepID=A0ABP1RET8_9HEXA
MRSEIASSSCSVMANSNGVNGVNNHNNLPQLGAVLFDNQVVESEDDELDREQDQYARENNIQASYSREEQASRNEIDNYNPNNDPIYFLTSTVSRNWEYVNVSLTRVPGYGFGIAVSGGCDNPHFANGDPAIAISDVLKGGPAQGKLQINDRIISANGISLDNVDYSTAVQILRDSGPCVNLRVKRRVNPQAYKVSIPINSKRIKKLNFESLGFTVSVTLQIKTVDSPALGLQQGDIIDKIQGLRVNELFNERVVVKELKRVVEESSNGNSGLLNLTVKRSGSHRTAPQDQQTQPTTSTGNLYVQPPTRNNKSFDNTNINTPPPPPPPRPPLPVEFENTPTPQPQSAPHRTINFIKQNQLGIRLSGGNKTGIIVSAVQKNSQAELQGLSNHDKIIRVNEHDFIQNPPTRENAIEILSSIPNDTLVNLTVERSAPIPIHTHQDEFFVRTRFQSDEFKIHELLLITDTLVNGMVGHWEAYRVDSNGNALKHDKLIIPNVKNARDQLKKSWKRTTSFRNREYEDLLACSVAVDPYDNVEKTITHDLSKRPIILYTPHNASVIDSLINLKSSSRVFKMIKSNDRLEFTDQRVRVIQDYVPVKYVQELHEKRIYPIVILCNFASKEAMKDAVRDASKYSKSKKIFNIMGKLEGKLGSFIDFKTEANDFEAMAQAIYRVVVDRPDAVSTVFAKMSMHGPRRQAVSTPATPQTSQTPSNFLTSNTPTHSRVKSSDNLASSSRTPTSPSPASMNSLKFPNFNIPPPCSVIDTQGDSTLTDKRVTIHRSHTSVGQSTSSSHHHNVPEHRQNGHHSTTQNNPTTAPTMNNFAHSPVFEKRDVEKRAQSIPPPSSRPSSKHFAQPTPFIPPVIDRTKKPSSSGGFYPVSPQQLTAVSKPSTPVKPVPPPKPKLPSLPKYHVQNQAHQQATSSMDESPDDTGQTYLNIPMNSKAAIRAANDTVTSGYFDWRGGRLVQKHVFGNQIPIEVFIPERAIPIGETINVWFQIIDYNVRDDPNNPQKMLSPLVKFGPENYRFQIPVEIRIPQYSAASAMNDNMLAKVLMNNQSEYWTKIDIQNGNYDNDFGSEVKVVSLTVQQF